MSEKEENVENKPYKLKGGSRRSLAADILDASNNSDESDIGNSEKQD